MHEGGALRFERFQILSEILIVPAEHGADPQCGLSAAGLGPACTERHWDPPEKGIAETHSKFLAIGFDYFGHDVGSVGTDWRAQFGADQSHPGDIHGSLAVPLHHAAGGFFADRSGAGDFKNFIVEHGISEVPGPIETEVGSATCSP